MHRKLPSARPPRGAPTRRRHTGWARRLDESAACTSCPFLLETRLSLLRRTNETKGDNPRGASRVRPRKRSTGPASRRSKTARFGWKGRRVAPRGRFIAGWNETSALSNPPEEGRLARQRAQQLLTSLRAAAAILRTYAAVLVMVGVLLALVAATQAGIEARLDDPTDE